MTLITGVSAIFWFGFKSDEEQVLPEPAPIPVEVERVKSEAIAKTLRLTGWIIPSQTVHIASNVAGRIESFQLETADGSATEIEEGTVVTQGQQLASIDREMYEAQVASAQARVKACEIERTDANREQQRIIALYESGSVTEQSKDKVVTAAALSEAKLSLAQADLRLAQYSLRETSIISPMAGIVITRHIDPGNLVRIAQNIVTIANVQTVKIVLTVAEKYSALIKPGMPVVVRVDAYPDKAFETTLYSIYPGLDQQAHELQIEVRLANPTYQLKPGMLARAVLIIEDKEDVIVIDRSVILGDNTGTYFAYIVQDGHARKRTVDIGIRQDARYEITRGLDVGQQLVINGMHNLIDGSPVNIVHLESIGVTP
jgi:membrane fusion protein, multidrug efflux system